MNRRFYLSKTLKNAKISYQMVCSALLLFCLLSTSSIYAQFAPYCGPLAYTYPEPITLVSFAGINNSSSALTTAPAHENFIAISGTVNVGLTYTLTVKGNTAGNYTDGVFVYIDWNKNNVFTDAGEAYSVGSITNSTGVDAVQLTYNLTVPMTATSGTTRMRVLKKYLTGVPSPSDGCTTGSSFGQVEDYSLNVVNPCSVAPKVKATAVTTPTCSNQPVKLYGTGAVTYVWSTGATTPTLTVNPTTTTTYTVTGTVNGCTATSSIVITVNPAPTVTVNPPSPDICVNDTITVSANGAATYVWSTGDKTQSVKIHPRENTVFSVVGTSANGCKGTATFTVNVKDFEVGVAVTKAAICEGESVTLSASGGTSYSWTPGNASGSSITVRPTTSTTYRTRFTGANGCVKYLDTYIEVYPKPIVFINDVKSGTTPPVCAGTELDLRAGGAYSYLWTPDSIPGKLITVAPKATTRYTVTGSSIWGCTSTASINIPVFAPTSARIDASTGKDPICKGKEITLTAIGITKPVWWPAKQTTNSITMVPKDIVYAEVTGLDANGCQVTLVFDARTIYCKDGGLVDGTGRSLVSSSLDVTVSPVPMRESAMFTFANVTTENMTLNVMSIDGRIIRSEAIAKGTDKFELTRNSISSGMYFYQIKTDAGQVATTGKIVVID